MKVLATYSIKGGVGKTSAAVNLAYLAAASGAPTLLWDLDPQGSATFLLRVRPKVKGGAKRLLRRAGAVDAAIRASDFPNLDLVPADLSYRHLDLALDRSKRPKRRLSQLLTSLEGEYDYVFLDCAPSMSLTSESVFAAADVLLVPTIPTTLSARTLDQLTSFLRDATGSVPDVLTFFSLADRRKRLHRDVMEELAKHPLLVDAPVPSATEIEQMGRHRAPVAEFAPRSRAARAYAALWHAVLESTNE